MGGWGAGGREVVWRIKLRQAGKQHVSTFIRPSHRIVTLSRCSTVFTGPHPASGVVTDTGPRSLTAALVVTDTGPRLLTPVLVVTDTGPSGH